MAGPVAEMEVLLQRLHEAADEPSSASAPVAKDLLRAYAIGHPVDKFSEAEANKVLTVLLREQGGDPNATLYTPFAIVVVLLASDRVAKGPAWTFVESHGVPRREAFKPVGAYTDITLAKEDRMARSAPSAKAPPTVHDEKRVIELSYLALVFEDG